MAFHPLSGKIPLAGLTTQPLRTSLLVAQEISQLNFSPRCSASVVELRGFLHMDSRLRPVAAEQCASRFSRGNKKQKTCFPSSLVLSTQCFRRAHAVVDGFLNAHGKQFLRMDHIRGLPDGIIEISSEMRSNAETGKDPSHSIGMKRSPDVRLPRSSSKEGGSNLLATQRARRPGVPGN